MRNLDCRPIEIIHTPYRETQDILHGIHQIQGTILVHRKFLKGISDLEGFSHTRLSWRRHLAREWSLAVRPRLELEKKVLSTRSPRRPNPTGMTVVEPVRIDGRVPRIRNVDMIDGTPAPDIRPYLPDEDRLRRAGKGACKAGIDRHSTAAGRMRRPVDV